MEKSKLSKKKCKPKYQESDAEESGSAPSRLNKKIKKIHHRKKGQISKGQPQAKNELALFLSKNPSYFCHSKAESTRSLKNKLQSKVHIREVLSPQNSFCFHKIRDNYEKQLEVYMDLLNSTRRSAAFEEIELVSLERKLSLKLRYLKEIVGLSEEGCQVAALKRMLTKREFTLLKLRQQAITQIEQLFVDYSLQKRYQVEGIPQNLLEILSLCKINATAEREITHTLDRIAQSEDPLFNIHLPTDMNQENVLLNQLIETWTVKNLEKSFSEAPIDFFNYHKTNQYYQENSCVETPIQNRISYLSQFKKYALAKKPKYHKSDHYLLRTACSACFTQYSELSNPIENCPECHLRIHRYCQKIEKRCHRCRYGRTSNLQKQQTSYCYICNRQREKGLMIITVTNRAPHQFAHEYCLMLHHFWKIEKQEFIGEFIPPAIQNASCIFCLGEQGHFLQCSCCSNFMHGMCAYLKGSSFKMERTGNDYKVEVKCCGELELRQRLSIERKFKINYEKIIFRQDEELYQYIEEKWKKE